MSLFDNYIIGMFVFILVGKNRKKQDSCKKFFLNL